MSKILAKVLPGHRVEHQPDTSKPAVIQTEHDAPFEMTAEHFGEASLLGSVRRATDADKAEGGNENPQSVGTSYSVEELANMKAEHRGGGVWDITLGEIRVKPEGFKSKEAAEAYLAEQRKLPAAE